MKMKPHLFCAVAMICACTVENPEDIASQTGLKEIRVEAAICDEGTKTSLGEDGKVLWTSGDEISLLNVSGIPARYELS